ncbi:septum formation protein Maf [Aquabacterium fontiphilum]|uniref:Maf family nucleotide pyrophosphatase n=1 Tax=Aquabacterium fontiphilum TaxID=450365 RepID=UPI00137738BC|nr:Maf family nucleotide pyrophosphatase [Aquabacterium fontiphilum]NBD21570.1 septum formation protein Maf [Aquabacterium fontiphilum]
MDLPRLILGSTSPYRRELLSRLRMPFDTQSPDVDETPRPGETPPALAMRLARAKAEAVAGLHPDDVVVIGSDQVADLAGAAIGKPGDHARARAQLRAMQGQTLRFHTAVCVVRPHAGFCDTVCDTVTVRMRALTEREIETYLRLDTPYDCAGSAKCESLGITLLDAIESTDPTSLVGLPLIATTRLMRAAGLDVLAALQQD